MNKCFVANILTCTLVSIFMTIFVFLSGWIIYSILTLNLFNPFGILQRPIVVIVYLLVAIWAFAYTYSVLDRCKDKKNKIKIIEKGD